MSQLAYQYSYTIYQVSFCLWRIGSVVKYCKVPKSYDQDSLKSFLFLSKLPVMIQISAKSVNFARKGYFYQKMPISQAERFLKSNFDPNQIKK